tara:strand:+ start:732 stop:1154 length:423 start_codon:yes stop_codon:yes gene_type:complete
MNLLVTATISIIAVLSSFNDETQYTKSDLLDAICQVESDCDSGAVGDGGDSIGAYQIQWAYWYDAVEFSGIGGNYEDVLNKEYARKIILAYWDRYATKKRLGHEPTLEDLARIHNGGPNGYKKESTVKYWEKTKNIMGLE